MLAIQQMVKSHPHPPTPDYQDRITKCIEACLTCVATCNSCASACLAEAHVSELLACIRLDMDCADVCTATGRIVARQGGYDDDLLHSQLQACVTACTICARECSKHAEMHEHCKVCAEACQRCATACEQVLSITPM